jgi:hypothetical protein
MHFAVESEFISSLHIRYKMCFASWWNVELAGEMFFTSWWKAKRRVLHSCSGVELASDLIAFSNATYDSWSEQAGKKKLN